MAALFQYQPHVHRDGKVYTPDLLVAHARIHAGGHIGNRETPLPIDRLTVETSLQQVGSEAHGIAALVVIGGGDNDDQGPLLTVGSLHGHRGDLLACAKPISRQAWRLADVAGHLDRISLRGWHLTGDARVEASDELLTLDAGNLAATQRETLVFHGATKAATSAGQTDGFEATLEDPVLERTLSLTYAVELLT